MRKPPKPLFDEAPDPAPGPSVAGSSPVSAAPSSATPVSATRASAAAGARPLFPREAAGAAPERRPPAPLFTEAGTIAPELLAALDAAVAGERGLATGERAGFRRAVGRAAADLAALPPTDPAPFMAFGAGAQARVTAVPDAMLSLTADRGDGVEGALRDVVAAVRSVEAEDLLPTGVGALILRRLVPPEDRLRNAVAAVELAAGRAARALPVVEAGHGRVVSLLREEAEARRNLLVHLRAGEAVLGWRGGTGAGNYALASLEERLVSLRVTLASSAGDVTRLTLLRDTYARLIGATRSGIPELVAAWKRGCSTVLIRLAARDGAALGAAAADLTATRDRLVTAIEEATR